MDTKRLLLRSLLGLLQLVVILAVLLFVPGGSVRWWQAWTCLTLFGGASLAMTLWLLVRDPALIERRLRAGPRAETRPVQKWIQAVAAACWLATWVVPALDRRFGWSAVPVAVEIGGDVLVALGMLVVFLVFRENTFASSTIGVQEGQRVVATGPYRRVRHPMYAGGLLLFVGVPLALGSWWALLPAVPLAVALVARLLDEERLLVTDLPGYREYRRAVRYRLVPGVW